MRPAEPPVVPQKSPDRPKIADESINIDFRQDYQSACSEIIILRKGLVEILESVQQQDGILLRQICDAYLYNWAIDPLF